MNTVPVPVIMDNLISKKQIPPMMIDSPGYSRFADLACSVPFTEFLVKEAVPWTRSNYHITAEPGRTFVGGASLGGLASACAALRHPEIFGNVLAQSGAFAGAPDDDLEAEWLARHFVASPQAARDIFS